MKYMNVPFFENCTPICSFLLGFKVGRYAAPKTPRKIFQYHKANHVGLKDAVLNFSTEFLLSSPELNIVDENWTKILNFLNTCIVDFISSKLSKSWHHLPWISPCLKRQMRKRDRMFKKAQ